MKRRFGIIVALLVIYSALLGCGASTEAVGTAVAETIISRPSQTFYPTYTNYPTYTLIPTQTLTPTITITHTPVYTSTPSETPTSPLTSAQLTGTSLAETRIANNAGYTATAEAKAKASTATRQSKNATATEIASYNPIYWKELVTYPYNHKGEKVKITGVVFNVIGNTDLQIWISGAYEAVYIVSKTPFSEIYDNNSVIVYGVVSGEHCFKNAYDAEICQPLIEDAYITK